MGRVASGRPGVSPSQSGESNLGARQRQTHRQFQKTPRARQPTWAWQVHLVGVCGGKDPSAKRGADWSRLSNFIFSSNFSRSSGSSSPFAHRPHSTLQKQWHFAELLVAVAAAASADVVDSLRAEVCMAHLELYRISQLMRDRTRRNGSFFFWTSRHCRWYAKHLETARL